MLRLGLHHRYHPSKRSTNNRNSVHTTAYKQFIAPLASTRLHLPIACNPSSHQSQSIHRLRATSDDEDALTDDPDESLSTDQQLTAPHAATATSEASPAATAAAEQQQEEDYDVDTTIDQSKDVDDTYNSSHIPPQQHTSSSPSMYYEEPDTATIWKLGLGGIVALAGLAGLAFMGHKVFKSQAPKVQKAMEQRQLAKESQQRLNEFMATLRNQITVDLSAKNLGDEGFAYIVDSLSFNDRCAAVDFSKNGIGTMGIAQLAQALASNKALESLILDTNAAGDEGAAAIAAALTGGSRLKTLNLSSNNIGDAGAKALAEMLKTNTTLETLELNGNVIDYEGVSALAEALTQNTTLKVLGLR